MCVCVCVCVCSKLRFESFFYNGLMTKRFLEELR